MDNGLPYRIRKIRESFNETMEEFGKKHFDPPASKGIVSNWENGYNKPNKKRLDIIAELGDISVDELLHGYNNLYYDINRYLKEYFDEEVVDRLKNANVSEKDITSFFEDFKKNFIKTEWKTIKPFREMEVDYQIEVDAHKFYIRQELENEVKFFLFELEHNIEPGIRVVLTTKSSLNELKSDIDFFDSFINHVETENHKLEKKFIQSYRQFVNITEQLIEKYRAYD